MTRRARVIVIVFLVLLAFELAGMGVAGVAAWRARRPWRTLDASFEEIFIVDHAPAQLPEGVALRFVGPGRLAVAVVTSAGRDNFYSCDLWSLDSATLEWRLEKHPDRIDPASGRGLEWSDWSHSSALVNLVTGAREELPWTKGTVGVLAPGGEIVADITWGPEIELHAIRDGTVVRRLPLPQDLDATDMTRIAPKITFSPRGDRLAVVTAHRVLWECDLATERWREVGYEEPLGFTPSGLVVLDSQDANAVTPLLVLRDGSQRVLVPGEKLDRTAVALAWSGERFAFVREVPGRETCEAEVLKVETGRVLRCVPAGRRGDVRCLALSPEGDRLAVASVRGHVEIWEIPSTP